MNAKEQDSSEKKETTEEWNRLAEERIGSLGPGEALAFVDGSYNAGRQTGGYGVIYLEQYGVETLLQGGFSAKDHPQLTKLRNVAAELLGVRSAVNRAVSDGKEKLFVFYDYAGIEHWAIGTWKTNLAATEEYAAFMKEMQTKLTIVFQKVPAHTGVSYNERADRLAKKASEEVESREDSVL